MGIIKNKLAIVFAAGGLLLGTSCNSWLDVTPEGQVQAEELYETAKGCNAALGGIYYILTAEELYGRELSYGMRDVLAQYYESAIVNDPQHTYYELSMYNYEWAGNVSLFNSVWSYMYQAIAECNALIYYLEPNAAAIEYSDLILGEAYALRAWIHMELFEMYGPVIHTKADLSKKAIAYRSEFNVVSQLFDTGDDVLKYAESDLQKALELMRDDPIKVQGRRADGNQSLLDYYDVLNYRGGRMNYYCALGLLARLEMLRQNPDEAFKYVTRFLDESKGVIRFVDKNEIESTSEMGKDLNYSSEMLGALYTNELYVYTNRFFSMEGESDQKRTVLIDDNLYAQWMNEVYGRTPDGSGTDNRFRYWFGIPETSGGSVTNNYYFKKLHAAYNGGAQELGYYPEVPIMRLSEIYYIACEANIGKNNEAALGYLNDVRRTRNLQDLEDPLDDATLKDFLIREMRKDFIGEGRMFSVYKRLFCPIYVKSGKIIDPQEAYFVFPIPDAEYEYTDNEKPNV